MSENPSSVRSISRQCSLRDILTKGQLEQDFFGSALSLRQVSIKYSCQPDTIMQFLGEYGIHIPRELKRTSKHVRQLLLQGAELTPRQKSIVVGALLGDASINIGRGAGCRNASIRFWQGKGKKGYVEWLHKEMEPFSRDIRQIKGFEDTFEFSTVCYPAFNEFYNMFRKYGPKAVPENIQDCLSILGLAVWFMDDGCTQKSYSFIATYAFSFEDCERLVIILEDQFNLQAKVRMLRVAKTQKGYPELMFRVEAHKKLHSLIDPLLHSCFDYKKLKEQSLRD
jgi:hypothetical protein